MSNFFVHEYHPIPIFQNNIGVEEEDLKLVKSLEYERMDTNNGSFTKDKYILNKMPVLKNKIEKQIELFTRNYLKINKDIGFRLLNSWTNIHYPNDFAQSHTHINSVFSGVYYLQTTDNSGDLEFSTPHFNNNISKGLLFQFDEYTHVNANHYRIKPYDGEIVIFPSHLAHGVCKNESDQERYSLAFNVFPTGVLGDKETELKL